MYKKYNYTLQKSLYEQNRNIESTKNKAIGSYNKISVLLCDALSKSSETINHLKSKEAELEKKEDESCKKLMIMESELKIYKTREATAKKENEELKARLEAQKAKEAATKVDMTKIYTLVKSMQEGADFQENLTKINQIITESGYIDANTLVGENPHHVEGGIEN